MRSGQMLAAGDVIFTDARDMVDAVGARAVGRAPGHGPGRSSRGGGMANEQSLLAGG